MEKLGKTAKFPSTGTTESNRSEIVFGMVGVGIILGGLWLLYDTGGPYHPDIPVTDTQIHQTVDS